jgi:hypothetical protein
MVRQARRNIRVDQARRKTWSKRDHGPQRIVWIAMLAVAQRRAYELLALREALNERKQQVSFNAQIVGPRYCTGMNTKKPREQRDFRNAP